MNSPRGTRDSSASSRTVRDRAVMVKEQESGIEASSPSAAATPADFGRAKQFAWLKDERLRLI